MLNVLRLAWLSSVRQPGRTGVGVLGIAAVGALLFDMLLLSHGLVLSFRDLLDRAGFDLRVLATAEAPFTIVGVGEFPFDAAPEERVAGRLSDLRRLCGEPQASGVDMLLVRSNPRDGADRAAAAIQAQRPGVHVVTNEQIVERFSRVEF